MPSLKMKTKLNMDSSGEKSCLSVCQKSSMISKKSGSHVAVSRQTAECDAYIQKCQNSYVQSRIDIYTPDIELDEAIDRQEFLDETNSQFQKHSTTFADSGTMGRMESALNCTSNLETIFSPALEPVEIHNVPNKDDDAVGSNKDLNVPSVGADDSDDNRSSCDNQTCNVSDFFISDMIIAGLPFDGNRVDDDILETNPFPDYKCAEPSILFDVAEECVMLPFLEDTAKVSDSTDTISCEERTIDQDNASLYLAINQIRSCNQESDLNTDSDQIEDFDPQFFIKNLPELSDVESNFRPTLSTKESWRKKSTTLVLDLDETLVHSTLEPCDDADFTFTVFFNMNEHTVYVKQRPFLHTFLERVAEMFEVVIFTASQSIYAAQLLDILDPDKKLISQRVYRESCIFTDGSYTKDLTVLGVDLAKVAIIDNSPQVFRLQVNNGIPIKSWFSDPSDCALISLLPFLETLVDADDVRPIIANRFGNKE
ncbi:CTD small phosphatase-like protein 2 isoform X1 [Manihot esculenta]|uniref:FCP1 homology domain-containing protein n=1 Tax=Manihot esculenta TaxID=3983 RepID=A0A2C9UF15_MANES|nr:CTD small phosphatase-like protein 2 isoform X1 [Manihot esculenta]XP_021595632.1 CTD small phosphatase-like protein 2 isoform X1 [Manihot esculenta]XP_043807379.1 CTD small phosphatase-like protein 2 isoform X1 [Manihot esculenta]